MRLLPFPHTVAPSMRSVKPALVPCRKLSALKKARHSRTFFDALNGPLSRNSQPSEERPKSRRRFQSLDLETALRVSGAEAWSVSPATPQTRANTRAARGQRTAPIFARRGKRTLEEKAAADGLFRHAAAFPNRNGMSCCLIVMLALAAWISKPHGRKQKLRLPAGSQHRRVLHWTKAGTGMAAF